MLIVRMPSAIADNRAMTPAPASDELRPKALEALQAQNPDKKVALTQYLWVHSATLLIANDKPCQALGKLPGSPSRPELRFHLDVPKRSPFTAEGLAALLHAVTHIEFNAIKSVPHSMTFLTRCTSRYFSGLRYPNN